MHNSEVSTALLKLAEQWRSTEVLLNGISSSLPFEDWLNAIASGQKTIELKAPAIAINPLQRLQDEGLVVTAFGGFDPVLCEATFPDGKALYFRASGESWELAIAFYSDDALDGTSECFTTSSEYGNKHFDAGYMPLEVVANLILASIALYQLSCGKGAIA